MSSGEGPSDVDGRVTRDTKDEGGVRGVTLATRRILSLDQYRERMNFWKDPRSKESPITDTKNWTFKFSKY